MSTDEVVMEDARSPRTPTEPAAMAADTKKRPRLDVSEPQKRKRGMFGVLLGTLKQAKQEDKERNASEAAKKRQLIDLRLQTKLKRETDSVRRAEEARKEKLAANRKEEELQLKDSLYKLRRSRLPVLANFLLTSDIIPPTSTDEDPAPLPLALAAVPRGHPPPLYYLPAVLTPAQESYISRRKVQVLEAVNDEYTTFLGERSAGIIEVAELRKAAAEEDTRKREAGGAMEDKPETPSRPAGDVDMEVDDHDSATLGSGSKLPLRLVLFCA
uniref:Pinin/SDK/MemA protein domain-containing protein n=1 Tax=Mycena chlorophos TaxID=658473 RepID=A0ABQ0LA79_MYCCL|nr:predicted protein [Mycena chlorophos]